MALASWSSLALLGAVLWWPAGWPTPLAPEIIALLVMGASLLEGRKAFVLLLPVACTLLQAERNLADRLPVAAAGRDFIVRGQVCDFPRRSGRALRFPLYLDSRLSAPGLPARVQLAWYDPVVLPRAGDSWQFVVRLRPPRTLALRSPGSLLRGDASALDGAYHGLHGDHGDPSAGRRPLRRAGAHLMAISGLHIGLLAGAALLAARAVGYLLVRCGCCLSPRRLGLVSALVVAAGYAGLAGFALPTRRALLMLAIFILFSLTGRAVAAWTTLTVTLWLVLVSDGLSLLTAGFWLSFGAVAVLLTATLACSRGDKRNALVQRIGALGDAQWRVFLGLAPVGALCFGVLAPVSPLANFVAVPLFGVAIMPLALAGVVLAATGISTAPLLSAADLLQGLLDWLAWLDIGAWPAPAPPAWYWPMAAVATVTLLWPRPMPGRWLAVGLLLLAPLLAPRSPAADAVRVQVLDVGQGLAVIVQTRRHALVYDTGPAFGAGDAGLAVVLPALRQAGIRRVDAIVVSHGDNDHAGGLASLHAAHPQAFVLAPRPSAVAAPAADCRRGQGWAWDGVKFRFLHPSPGFVRGPSNDRSCVLLVQAAGASLLLPGDVSRRGEANFAGQLPPEGVDLVVAPHHGSATSSSQLLVKRSRPRYVAFTAGHLNRWGFPRPSVLARWQRTGACLVNTASEGTLLFDLRDGRLALQNRHRRDAARAWTLPPGEPECGADDTTL